MTTETLTERGWTEDGQGTFISPVRHPRPRKGKHDTRVWQYGPAEWACSCSGCGFNLVDVDEDTARDAAARHWQPGYQAPVKAETLFTSKGEEIEVRCSDKQVLAYLIGQQLTNDQRGCPSEFVDSLIAHFNRRGEWSPGQRPWAHKLGYEWKDRQDRVAEQTDTLEERKSDERFPTLVALLQRAREKGIKYPKLTAEFDAGTIRLSLAGAKARYPGSINVTDGGSFEDGTFYGRIHTDGRFEAGRRCADWILAALTEFNADPAGQARLHGQRTGNCCFCRRHLETSESVTAGYGPVCADRYGLPWGDTEGYRLTIDKLS